LQGYFKDHVEEESLKGFFLLWKMKILIIVKIKIS